MSWGSSPRLVWLCNGPWTQWPSCPSFLLLDAISLPRVSIPQRSIVKGDVLCISISAASIVAKVARDDMMEREDKTYPGYGFAQHKGYGTPGHIRSIDRLGPCPIHRRSLRSRKRDVRRPMRDSRRQVGRRGEEIARSHLEKLGFSVLGVQLPDSQRRDRSHSRER